MSWRPGPQRHGSTVLKVGLLLLLAAAAFDGAHRAAAQDDPTATESASPPDPEPTVPDPPGHVPFMTWEDGPGVIPFESLSSSEQEGVMEQARRSETNAGYDVAQAWSAYSHEMADTAAAETARRLAGLTGTDDLGVAP
jgi:hypothetical protein